MSYTEKYFSSKRADLRIKSGKTAPKTVPPKKVFNRAKRGTKGEKDENLRQLAAPL
ncbi:MAG: hypothetical protein IJV69_02175 [Kiritimatiellae bacterium]|nr:hypothetical protein [Kiritimatiellia bacterium]